MFFHRYPFLRLLLPLVVGIYVGDVLFFKGVELSMRSALWGLLTLFIFMVASGTLKRYTLRWVFGASLFLFSLLAGFSLMIFQLQETADNSLRNDTIHRVCIVDYPEEKERTMRFTVSANSQTFLLYLSKDSLSKQLQRGDELLTSTHFAPPEENDNGAGFNYPRYLLRKQVSGVGYCSSGEWVYLAHGSGQTLQQQALEWRDKLLNRYRELGFTGDELAVLSALTVGYKDELSEEIRESYSISGASHVLALSGLHIGFLYAMLLLLLRIIPNKGVGVRWLRALIIIALLWMFAFFTGLSPSVVRSVLMCSLFALSTTLNRESFSIHTLIIAAFFMLLCCPAWLFDVGFQLSFFAVAAILIVQPAIYKMIPVRNRFIDSVWKLISVSLAAQLGTAPLVLFYFSRFSTHFLLTNLMVILLVSLIMYGAVIFLLLTPFAWLQAGVVWMVKRLLQLLNGAVRWIEQLPWASIDNVYIHPLEVILFYLFISFCFYYCISQKAKVFIATLFSMLLLLAVHVAVQVENRPSESITFYPIRGCSAVHCVSVDGRSWLACADSFPDEKQLRLAVARRWKGYPLKELQIISSDYQDDSFLFRDNLLSFNGERVCFVSDNRWARQRSTQPLPITYLYIGKGYTGQLAHLSKLFLFTTVVLDASLSNYRLRGFKKECKELGYSYISLAEQGSVQFLL